MFRTYDKHLLQRSLEKIFAVILFPLALKKMRGEEN